MFGLIAGLLMVTGQDGVNEHIAALGHDDAAQRIAAAKALRDMGPEASSAVPALMQGLRDVRFGQGSERVAESCAAALAAIGPDAYPAVVNALRSDDPATFIGATVAISKMENPPDTALTQLLRLAGAWSEEASRARQQAFASVKALPAFGRRAGPVFPVLMKMLESKSFHDHVAACEVLAAMGPEATKAVPRLLKMIDNERATVSSRGHALLAVGRIGPVPDHDVVAVVTRSCTAWADSLRDRALISLGSLGPAASGSADTIRGLLDDRKYRNHARAAHTLWKISGETKEPIAVLLRLTTKNDLDAVGRLGDMGPAASTAVPMMLKLLKSADADKRYELTRALEQIAPHHEDFRAALARMAKNDADAEIRKLAARILQENPPLPKLGDRLTEQQVVLFAELALKNIDIEYPNKPSNVMAGPESVRSPKAMHPAFYGCFDWHSSIHGHWMLVRLLKAYPDSKIASKVRASLNKHLTRENLQAETAYFSKPHNSSFERMYGWAWAFRLAAELHDWDDTDGKRWRENLKPLENLLVQRTLDYLPRLTYPIRTGVHPDSGFALGQTLDYARTVGNRELEKLIVTRSREYYLADRDYPFRYEPSGQDFFSSGLNEADLMRRVLSAEEFAGWLDSFFPDITKPDGFVTPVEVSDVTDGKIVHLAGLDLSRAWCMQGIAAALPKDDPRVSVLTRSAADHARIGFGYVFSGHYEGEHWLATFAIYALDRVGM